MILLDIILDNEEIAGKISRFLIENKYAVQTHVDTNTVLTQEVQKKTIRLFFITKALLYHTIEEAVKKNFPNPNMIVYATPVSHINEEFGELLRKNIKAI